MLSAQIAAAEGRKNIVVIGGGIIGCTTAYYLTRHPAYDPHKHQITLLEASRIAGGASGKAGGLLALWAYPSSLVPLSYRLHKELADAYGGEERWGYRTVSCGQIDCQGRHLPSEKKNEAGADSAEGTGAATPTGGANGSTAEEHVSLQKRSKEAISRLRAAGVPVDLDWVSPETNLTYDEMGDPSTTAQVHPFHFTTAMAELAQEKGAVIKVGAAVKGITYNAAGNAVTGVKYADKTAGGAEVTIPATDVIVAAGPWTPTVLPNAPITATRAHSVVIRPTRPVSAYALFTQIKLPAGFGRAADQKGGKAARLLRASGRGEQIVTPEIYARPKNEVYACGEGDRTVPLPPTTDEVEVDEGRCQDIIEYASSISDELRDGEVTARQACYLPNATSGGPLVGFTDVAGLILAAGHTCWGIQNGPGTGKLVSELVFDGRARSAQIQSLDPRLYL